MPCEPSMYASAPHHSDVASLVQRVRIGTDDEKSMAATSLGVLACESKANRDQIRDAGGISALVALARVGTSEQRSHASSALAALGPETRNKPTFLERFEDWSRAGPVEHHPLLTASFVVLSLLMVYIASTLRGTVGIGVVFDQDAKCAEDYRRASQLYDGVVVHDAEALGENTNGQFRHTTRTHIDGALECIPVGIYILAHLPVCAKYRTLLHEVVHYHQCLTTHDKNRVLPPERMRSMHPLRPIWNYEPHVDRAVWEEVATHYPPEQWDVELEARALERFDGIWGGTSLFRHLQ